jgi:prophage regulatory protein
MEPVGPTFDRLLPTVMIGKDEVLRRTHLKKSTMYKYIQDGKFSRQVKLTDGTVGWDEEEIEDWIQRRKALRPVTSSGQEETSPKGPQRKRRNGNVLSLAAELQNMPQISQLERLNTQQTKRMLREAPEGLRNFDPEYFIDTGTGTVRLRVMQIENVAPHGSFQ